MATRVAVLIATDEDGLLVDFGGHAWYSIRPALAAIDLKATMNEIILSNA